MIEGPWRSKWEKQSVKDQRAKTEHLGAMNCSDSFLPEVPSVGTQPGLLTQASGQAPAQKAPTPRPCVAKCRAG